MDGKRPHSPLGDEALDRELESALGIEPSPEFLARVRTRLASEPGTSPWRQVFVASGFGRTRKWVMEPLVAVAMIGIVLTIVVPEWSRDSRPFPRPRPVVQTPPVEADLRVSQPLAGPEAVVPPARPRQTRDSGRPSAAPAVAQVRHELPLSEPLFSDDDRRLLALLVTAVGEGRVPPRPEVNEVEAERRATGEMPIEPLVIEPLPLLARIQPEGERE